MAVVSIAEKLNFMLEQTSEQLVEKKTKSDVRSSFLANTNSQKINNQIQNKMDASLQVEMEDVGREEPCVERLNVLKYLQAYNL